MSKSKKTQKKTNVSFCAESMLLFSLNQTYFVLKSTGSQELKMCLSFFYEKAIVRNNYIGYFFLLQIVFQPLRTLCI